MALTLYKASAGTGKTYRLTLNYLLLLMGHKNDDRFDPMAFSRILAVTFTNKATEEMKTRILESLEKLMTGQTEDPVWKDVQLVTGLDDDRLQQRAATIHAYILHNYSSFSVSTLDAFFQKVLQSFVVEAGLSLEYSIDLDTPLLLEKTAAEVIDKAARDKALHRRLTGLLQDHVRNADNWDLTKLLKDVGWEITKESFRTYDPAFIDKLSDESFMNTFRSRLYLMERAFERQMQSYGQQGINTLEREGLTAERFPQKSRSFAAYFPKITRPNSAPNDYEPNNYTRSAAAGEDKMWKGAESFKALLLPVVSETVAYFDAHFTDYCTARILRKELPQMMLVADIYRVMRQLQQQSNTLNISESTYLLSTLVGEGDAPFVYEKTGAFYSSFLLDEFQDTSLLQWKNIRPLLHEGLSKGATSLVVGDVKQSIYRWRNGDWRILGRQIAQDPLLTPYGINTMALSENYRSRYALIDFANHLTEQMIHCVRMEDPDTPVPQAYDPYLEQWPQNKPPQEEGYAQVMCFENSPIHSADEQTLAALQQLLARLQQRGYAPQDLLILVRRNAEGQAIMNYLMRYRRENPQDDTCYNLVSSDSLSLDASPHVRLAIAVLQRALYPGDDSIREVVHYLEQVYGPREHPVADDREFLEQLKNVPVSQAFEMIMQRMEWTQTEEALPYLQELHDLLLTFSKNDSSGLYGFCTLWEQKGKEYSLTSEVSVNAIRILTIHKAKGLQAPVVIVPFCDWPVNLSGEILWAHTDRTPFNELERMPVKYGKELMNTHFAQAYEEEKRQKQMDALNMLYVAVTRPRDELYLFFGSGTRRGKTSIAPYLEQAMHGMTDHPEGPWCFGTEVSRQAICNLHHKEERPGEQTYTLTEYPSGDYRKALHLTYEEEPFAFSEEDSMRQWGIVLHKALSAIECREDVPAVLEQLAREGEIAGNTEALQRYTQSVEEVLSREDVAPWFDGTWTVRNEASLLCAATEGRGALQLRPDRVIEKDGRVVVIDYKFGQEKPAHRRQMDRYVETLRSMGYTRVEGHLLYFNNQSIYKTTPA